jgi:hypothetical protein
MARLRKVNIDFAPACARARDCQSPDNRAISSKRNRDQILCGLVPRNSGACCSSALVFEYHVLSDGSRVDLVGLYLARSALDEQSKDEQAGQGLLSFALTFGGPG